jgi:hypothetical protein
MPLDFVYARVVMDKHLHHRKESTLPVRQAYCNLDLRYRGGYFMRDHNSDVNCSTENYLTLLYKR